MACAAVPAPQQLQSWLVLAMGNPILQLTYGSHCSSAGFARGSLCWTLQGTKAPSHLGYFHLCLPSCYQEKPQPLQQN